MTQHPPFDEATLFARKNNFMGFRFCPLCATALKPADLDGRTRLRCPAPDCGYIFYQNPIPAAGAVIVEDNRILMVKRAHPPKIGWWTLPAGFMEWDEHPTQTAVRELKEETGLDVRLTDFFEVYSGSDDCRNNAILILYLAERIGGTLVAGDDASEVRFFGFDELPDRIAFESHRRALAYYQEKYLTP
jgi:8-oxo-dGTP diphosphatase